MPFLHIKYISYVIVPFPIVIQLLTQWHLVSVDKKDKKMKTRGFLVLRWARCNYFAGHPWAAYNTTTTEKQVKFYTGVVINPRKNSECNKNHLRLFRIFSLKRNIYYSGICHPFCLQREAKRLSASYLLGFSVASPGCSFLVVVISRKKLQWLRSTLQPAWSPPVFFLQTINFCIHIGSLSISYESINCKSQCHRHLRTWLTSFVHFLF